MPDQSKTNCKYDDVVTEQDLNSIGDGSAYFMLRKLIYEIL